MEINEQVEKILAYGDCCDHCLGTVLWQTLARSLVTTNGAGASG